MPPIPLDLQLRTPRLTLRRFQVGDAERVVEIAANWSVGRMIRLAPYPPTLAEKRAWLASHEAEWLAGEGYRFAVIEHGRLVGCADIDELASGANSLGYWLDEAAWGRGIATEAATAVRDFAVARLDLDRLTSGHAFDNPDSGKVLAKLGFRRFEDATVWSVPRRTQILQHRYELRCPDAVS